MIYFLRHIVTLFLFSCSWGTLKKSEVKQEKKDLVERFELDAQQLEKFKTTGEEPIEIELVDAKPTKEKEASVPVPTPAPSAQVASPPLPEKKLEEPPKVVNPVISITPPYPEDKKEIFTAYDEKSAKVWSSAKFNFPDYEKTVLDVSFYGVTVGKIALMILPPSEVGKEKVYHFYAKLLSAPFYRFIYNIDDYIESYVSQERFLPLKYALVQRESSQDVDDLQLFDNEKLKTYSHYKRVKKAEEKKESLEASIPKFYQDSFSALYFVRGLPLNTGTKYEFPVLTRSKLWMISVEVLEKETLKIFDGTKQEAFKLKIITQYPGVLEKRGDAFFWLATTPEHRVLKFEAQVKLGSISGVLTEYSNQRPSPSIKK